MAIAAIHDWFSHTGSFAAGVDLLLAHSSVSRADAFLFSLPESPVLRDRLSAKLREVLAQAEASILSQPAPTGADQSGPLSPMQIAAYEQSIRAEPTIDFPPDRAPKEIISLITDVKAAHKEGLLLQGLMLRTPDGAELTSLAARRVELDRFNSSGWKRIEYWRATGNVIAQANPDPSLDRSDALKRRQALRTWFSQRKEGAANRRSFTQVEWDSRLEELKQLDRTLNGTDPAT